MPRAKAPAFLIRRAEPGDEAVIADLIRALAVYEKLEDQCVATPEKIREQLFGPSPVAEALLAFVDQTPAGFALFFRNFSTFLARPGFYLEDIFIQPEFRALGIGTALMRRLASMAVERGYGRVEWATLDWNELAHRRWRAIGAQCLDDWRLWRLTGPALANLAAQDAPPPAPPAKAPGKTASAAKAPAKKTPAAKPAKAPASKHEVVIHTDGGCQPNPGVGAWAAVLESGGRRRELTGGEDQTTNNRMELMAAIRALETLKSPCRVILYTDSEYLKKGVTEWMAKWKRQGWRRGARADSAPVKNVDLWMRLDAALEPHEIEWRWVEGHSGDEANERCDALCHAEIARRYKAGAGGG